jgi:uncharacterized coiled-coil protein SlyX
MRAGRCVAPAHPDAGARSESACQRARRQLVCILNLCLLWKELRMSQCSQETSQLFSRKGLWVCIVAAIIACAWAASDAYAGKGNKGNGGGPSDTGAANGVAHRVAALEAQMATALATIAALDADLAAVEGQVATLQTHVDDLEARVAALEAAAAAP